MTADDDIPAVWWPTWELGLWGGPVRIVAAGAAHWSKVGQWSFDPPASADSAIPAVTWSRVEVGSVPRVAPSAVIEVIATVWY